MVGYLLVSPFSDRFGHRKLVIISTFAFALLTFVTGHATNVTELIALRFLTGIALGSVVPSAIALTTEFSPARLRATFVLAIYAGFSLGFVAAGAVAAWAIPEYGWRSMLWIGGAAPMVVAILALMFLPESMDFLIRTKAQPEAVSGVWCVSLTVRCPCKGRRNSSPRPLSGAVLSEVCSRPGAPPERW
ncbi:MFS family permease [Bradyrhizobium sp. LM6.10]